MNFVLFGFEMMMILCLLNAKALGQGRMVKLNSDSGIVEFEIGNADCQHFGNAELHWFHKQKLHSSEGAFDGRPLNGSYTSFYPNGQLREKGGFRCGAMIGMWKRWWPNGKLMSQTPYINGLIDGKQTRFDASSYLTAERAFRKGRLHGRCVYHHEDEDVEKKYRNGTEIVSADKGSKMKNKDGRRHTERTIGLKKKKKERRGRSKEQ